MIDDETKSSIKISGNLDLCVGWMASRCRRVMRSGWISSIRTFWLLRKEEKAELVISWSERSRGGVVAARLTLARP